MGAGRPDRPAVGEVVLLDGRRLNVQNDTAWDVPPGKSVWLARDEHGVFSILYAEV